jgi:CheY-like chemotaxis protein
MAEQSGGRLERVSAPGKGTTARLYFPIEQGPPLQATRPDADVTDSQKDKLKVLAVDDDALVLLNTRMMLEDMGHQVTTAPSGNVAMRLLREGKPFDLLITDHGMPGMTGTQLIAESRQLKPDMMIVLATGYAELPDGAPQGIVRLAKPFFQRHLDEALQAVLKLRSG